MRALLEAAALGSVGEPLIMTMSPEVLPPFLMMSTSVWAWILPTVSLSKDDVVVDTGR